MATYFPYLNDIQKIEAEVTNTNSDTVIYELNKNFKFSDEIPPYIVNNGFKNLFQALTKNTYNKTLVTTKADITTNKGNFIFTPSSISLPENGTSTLTVTVSSPLITAGFRNFEKTSQPGFSNGQITMIRTIYLPETNQIELQIVTNGLKYGGLIHILCFGKNNYYSDSVLAFNNT